MPGLVFLNSQLSSRKEDRLVPWTSKFCDKFLGGITGNGKIKKIEKAGARRFSIPDGCVKQVY